MNDHRAIADLIHGVAEIANFIGFERLVVARMLREGRLPAFQVGKTWCMRQSTYRQWIERLEPALPSKPTPLPPAPHEIETTEELGDEEVAIFPPGRYYQKKLASGRVALWRRGRSSKPMTAR